MAGHFQEMIELLYELEGNELRALAWEALLISDGPDAVHKPDETYAIRVHVQQNLYIGSDGEPREKTGFIVTAVNGWQTGINTMPDTPVKE
jgi:hypothetical protein